MLVYPCGLDVSSRSLSFLAARLREHRRRIGSRWRRLPVGRQALTVLAHLRNGTTYAQLAAGFGVVTSTVYRYISEAVVFWPLSRRPSTRPSGLLRGRRTSC